MQNLDYCIIKKINMKGKKNTKTTDAMFNFLFHNLVY